MSSKITASGGGGIGGSTGAADLGILIADGTSGDTTQASAATLSEDGTTLTLAEGATIWFGNANERVGYAAGVGPLWRFIRNLTHDISALGASNRTVTWPDATGAVPIVTATSTTVGAAGAADAPPTPLGYFTISHPTIGTVKVPYYNV